MEKRLLSERDICSKSILPAFMLCDRLEAALTNGETTRTRLLEALVHEALEPVAEVLEAAE